MFNLLYDGFHTLSLLKMQEKKVECDQSDVPGMSLDSTHVNWIHRQLAFSLKHAPKRMP